MDKTEIERRFVYHPPNDQTRAFHDAIRADMLAFAKKMNILLPDESREKSLFFTALE